MTNSLSYFFVSLWFIGTPFEYDKIPFDRRPNPAKPEPKRLCCRMDELPGNPPNPPLSTGGEGGFLKFLATLGAN
jgi:hypothetical protein